MITKPGERTTCFPGATTAPDVDAERICLRMVCGRRRRLVRFPAGANAFGCHQMIGDVWEWTTSDYVPYPGFKSEFDEYNDKWFVNQKVLRGGSFATPQAAHPLNLPQLLPRARALDDLRLSLR